MRKITAQILILVFTLSMFTGCFTMNHVVGDGASSTAVAKQERQWYILWGLVPLNDVNSKSMAEGATHYTVKTQYTGLDFLINIFTGIVSIQSMTVEVRK